MAGIPSKQDLQEMAASIVSTLSKEVHDIRREVEEVEERVVDLEESAKLHTGSPISHGG